MERRDGSFGGLCRDRRQTGSDPIAGGTGPRAAAAAAKLASARRSASCWRLAERLLVLGDRIAGKRPFEVIRRTELFRIILSLGFGRRFARDEVETNRDALVAAHRWAELERFCARNLLDRRRQRVCLRR